MPKKVVRSNKNSAAKAKKKQIKINDTKSLTKVRENVAGIDVGGEFHFVAAPDPDHDGKIVVNRFGSFTSSLKECVDLLKRCKIESVAMEATGVYWTTLYAMIKEAQIEVLLVNPRDFKKMKEKKTDVCDAEFLQLYHSYGLFQGAVVPEKRIGALRTFTRLREQAVMDSARAIQRMQKALINMNLRLDNVLNDISGVTGMKIIRAILGGERDPKVLAAYRDIRCKKPEEEIEESLNGFYQDDQLFALSEALREYEFYLTKIDQCDKQIESKLAEFETHENFVIIEDEVRTASAGPKKTKKAFDFSFDLKTEMARITGVDLTLLPGVGISTALSLIAETGLDMTQWSTEKHFVSWLGLAPNNKISGGRVLSNRSRRKKKQAALIMRMAVSSLYRESNDTAIGAFFRRKRAHLGPSKAITAAANKLARMYYMTLSTGKPFVELGAKAYNELQKAKRLRKIRKQVSEWGYRLVEIDPKSDK